MKNEKIIAIAKQVWGERLGVEYSTSEPVGYADCNHTFKPTNKLIAFARAIADIQKEKDAQICENEKVNYAATGDLGDLTYNTAIEHCINAISSPESDIDQATRLNG